MLADQQQRGFPHPVMVQTVVRPASPCMKQRVPDRGSMQKISVASTERSETSVKCWADNGCMSDRHPVWQMGVYAPHPGAFGTLGIGVEVDHLSERVNAGVGSPRAHRGDAVACDLSKCPL